MRYTSFSIYFIIRINERTAYILIYSSGAFS